MEPAWQRDAIEVALIENYPRLLSYAKKYSISECEDLLSKTVVRALENAHKLVDRRNVVGWLSTIMHNLFITDYRRDSWRRNKLEDLYKEIEKDLNLPSVAHEEDEAFLHLLCKISIIPVDYFVPLYYKAIGMKYSEIGNRLHVPLGTIMSRLHRGRKQAIEILEGTKGDKMVEPPAGSIAAEIVKEAREMKGDQEIADKLNVNKSLVASTKNFWRKKGCDIPYLKVPQKRTPALRQEVPKYEQRIPEPKLAEELIEKEAAVEQPQQAPRDHNLEMVEQIRRRVCSKLKALNTSSREEMIIQLAALKELVELADDIEAGTLESGHLRTALESGEQSMVASSSVESMNTIS